MSVHKLFKFPRQAPIGFVPSEDGPAFQINFPDNAPGFRRVVAAEGDLSGTQPDTIKYLLEITAANGTTATVARTLKLYTFDVENKELTYLHTLSGLPNAVVPYIDYAEIFWVNVAGGYYTFESNKTIYVIDLETGAPWGNSGSIGHNFGLSAGTVIHYATVPHPTNTNIFNLVYSNVNQRTAIRIITVNPTAKTVDWGAETVYAYSSYSYNGHAIPDTRSTANPGDWIIGRTAYSGTTNYFNPLVLNPTTGIMTAAPFGPSGTNVILPQGLLLSGDRLLFGGGTLTNMSIYSVDPWLNATLGSSISLGTAGYNVLFGFLGYHDLDGTYGKYALYTDSNTDIWVSRVPFENMAVAGVFGTALFKANTLIPGFALSGNITSTWFGVKPMILCKYGFFYVGHMNTTSTNGPVLWYQLTPNLP